MFRRMAFLAALGVVPAAAEETKPTDATTIRGVWEIVSTTFDGTDLAAKGRTLTFGDKEFTAFIGERKGRTIAYTLDPSANPKRVNLDRGGKNGRAFGIYSLEKDELKICYAEPGAERPKAFESKAGQKLFLLVLKRVKG